MNSGNDNSDGSKSHSDNINVPNIIIDIDTETTSYIISDNYSDDDQN